MNKDKKWLSVQSIAIIAIIILIFVYIGLDLFKIKPSIKNDMDKIQKDYTELSEYLDSKIPDIDSTLKIQARQLSIQGQDIDSLNVKVSALAKN